jgi:hypothetical protein
LIGGIVDLLNKIPGIDIASPMADIEAEIEGVKTLFKKEGAFMQSSADLLEKGLIQKNKADRLQMAARVQSLAEGAAGDKKIQLFTEQLSKQTGKSLGEVGSYIDGLLQMGKVTGSMVKAARREENQRNKESGKAARGAKKSRKEKEGFLGFEVPAKTRRMFRSKDKRYGESDAGMTPEMIKMMRDAGVKPDELGSAEMPSFDSPVMTTSFSPEQMEAMTKQYDATQEMTEAVKYLTQVLTRVGDVMVQTSKHDKKAASTKTEVRVGMKNGANRILEAQAASKMAMARGPA